MNFFVSASEIVKNIENRDCISSCRCIHCQGGVRTSVHQLSYRGCWALSVLYIIIMCCCSLIRTSPKRGGGVGPRICRDEDAERATARYPVQLQRSVCVVRIPCLILTFVITGVDSVIGFTQWANKPSKADASVCMHMSIAGMSLTKPFVLLQ
jgi:hypothetical protein